ncbi:hypothetical protein AB4175_10460 [Vibrio cyclitrophicus]
MPRLLQREQQQKQSLREQQAQSSSDIEKGAGGTLSHTVSSILPGESSETGKEEPLSLFDRIQKIQRESTFVNLKTTRDVLDSQTAPLSLPKLTKPISTETITKAMQSQRPKTAKPKGLRRIIPIKASKHPTDVIRHTEATPLTREEMIQRIENVESIQGYVNGQLYTHNTSLSGLLGVLSSQMMTTVEPNVNFRYGIDSRYAGGVTLVMKKGFESQFEDIRRHDLYKQRQIFFGENDSRNQVTDKLIEFNNASADFRGYQMAALSGTLKPIRSSKGMNKEAMKMNSRLSLVNHQVRIPWNKNRITHENSIEKILISKYLDEKISTPDFNNELKIGFDRFSTSLSFKSGSDDDKRIINSVIKGLNANKAIKIYNKLKREGKVKIVDIGGEKELFSHQVGRIGKRSTQDDIAMHKSAKLGLEIAPEYFSETMNNSPAALSIEALTKFEQEYFLTLLENGLLQHEGFVE